MLSGARLFIKEILFIACYCNKNPYIRVQRCGSIALGISSYRSFLISFYFVSCTSGNYIRGL